MPQPIRTLLRGNLSGNTEGGTLPFIPFELTLDDQATHDHVVVTVEDGDVLKPCVLPASPQQASTKQTLFVLVASGQVQVRLNATPELTFNIGANAPLIIGGLPEITQLHLTSLVAVEVKASVTKVFGATSLTDPAPGPTPLGAPVLDKFAATGGQTAFTLTNTPTPGTPVDLRVEGVSYTSPTWFTVAGTALTWNDVFVLPGAARVDVYYR